MLLRWSLAGLLMLCAVAARAAPMAATPMFRHFGVADGLPSSIVYKLAEDRDGFVWIGTHDGLARYDGVSFRVWRTIPGDAASIAGNEVSALFVDRGNRVWAGGEGSGLNVLDETRTRFRRYRHDPADPASLAADDVWAVSQDAGGAIWVGTYSGGLDRLRDDGSGFDHHRAADGTGLPSDIVLSLFGAQDGSLWIGMDKGLARRTRDGKVETVRLREGDPPQVLALCTDGDAVLAATSAGLFRIDAARTVERLDPNAAQRMLYASVRDAQGDLWLATRLGAVRHDAQHFETVYRAQPRVPGGLPGEAIFDLLADREGGVWFAAIDGGVAYLPPTWRLFSQWREQPGDVHSLSPGRVQGIAHGRDGVAWSVTMAGAVDRIDLRSGAVARWGERVGGIEQRRRAVMQDARGRLWLGQHRGLRIVDAEAGGARDLAADAARADMLPAGPIDLMLEDGAAVWISARGAGLARIDADTLAVTRLLPDASGLRDADVEQMRLAPDGALWVAHVRGIDRRAKDGERFAAVDGLPDARVHAFAFARDGSVWLHRFGAIEHYVRRGEAFVRERVIDAAAGWPALDAGAMELDAAQRLWISTPRGLYRVDTRSGAVRRYGTAASLIDSEFIDRSLVLREDGVALAATTDGLIAFDTAAAEPRLPPAPLLLTGVQVRRGTGAHAFDPAQPALLAWNDRDLRIEARALSYLADNRYDFLLQGFDSDWSAGSGGGQRELAQLRPGDYRLHVRAHTGLGDVVELAAPLQLSVQAPPWARPWAYALYLVLLGVLFAIAALLWRRRIVRQHALALASQRRELAEQASLAKSEFLAHMGHEIRTPMTGLLGMAELLELTPLNPRQHSYVSGIRTSGEHMLRLVNDALDLARVEAGRLQLVAASFDPQGVLRDVADVGHALAARKGIGFVVRLPVQAPVPVSGDAQRLRQILLNLVNNAIKFTDAGGVTLELARADAGDQCFRVSDTGPGIDAAMQARLFQRYSQDETGRRAGGSGLGLAISQELAQLMGGRIAVESAPGRGSVFTLQLHLPAAEAPIQATRDTAPATAQDIVLVEDEANVARVVGELLESLGHSVRHVPQALAALAEVAARRPRSVLLDLDLPDVSGLQLARLLRAQESGAAEPLRLVALTARSDADAERDAFAAGVDAFLRKPVTRAVLAAQFGDASPAR
ncbi:MAG TPA: ATP-binding protein [Tahibacter sp.]|uniref:hybrid sensor histidine kinase/response regulator n=1 Tax=Tahibacter sp. TaxID=2056211 RepID=UPI002B922128|nr:ATP-binding protein [Tahibacter sp.]HSX61310.1 ATP-binding protein [Tahibacter sp.]